MEQVVYYAVGRCWLGPVLVAATEQGLCAVRIGDCAEDLVRELKKEFKSATLVPGGPQFEETLQSVVEAIDRPEGGARPAIDAKGSAFEHTVWTALRAIPRGETRTYSDIAAEIGAPTSARAVARACAANPIGVLTPCHRVVRRDGSLAGYRWGIARKAALLERERAG